MIKTKPRDRSKHGQRFGHYCRLEDIVHMKSATFRPPYIKPEHPQGKLPRIR